MKWSYEHHDPTDAAVVLDRYGNEVCQVFGSNKRKRDKRAKLIAEAPALRSALAKMHDLFSDLVEDDKVNYYSKKNRRRVLAAFARSNEIFWRLGE